jgi:hypothetical protein
MSRTLTIITIVVALGVAATSARAQASAKGGISFGDVSNRGLLPGELDRRTGLAVGVGIGSAWTLIGIGIEGLYAQRGVAGSDRPDAHQIDYVDVPGYLRVAIPVPGVSPFAYAGPQISFEVRCRAGERDCSGGDRPNTTYAGIIGAGVRLGGRSALTLEGRYIYGLSDLKLATVTTSESYKDRSFLILGGVMF